MNIKIAIVDDHPMIIDGLQSILLRCPHISLLGSYQDGDELLEGLKTAVPDVLLLDIHLPGKKGDELTPIVLNKYPKIKILALTNFDDASYASNMFALGVHGYLLKTANKDTLIRAIEAVHSGDVFVEEHLKNEIQEVTATRHEASKIKLTLRQREILELIVQGKKAAEIAAILYLGEGTVRNYRNHLLKSMQVHNTAALVQKALKLGLVK